LCLPFIFLWQCIYTFFTYVEMAKREPDVFGRRRFTEYTKLKMRHFNELDHEFNSRLARAHRPATKYLNSFQNYLLIVLAEHLSYMFGAILAVLICLTVYDEDVLKVEHALTVMGILTAVVGILRGLIPKEEELNCPEQLMRAALKHLHYLPTSWQGEEHTERVRSQFDKMFQVRVNFIIEELLSPILIPYILYFKLRPRSKEILDFFRNNTVTVEGVGDVCALAANMDLLNSTDGNNNSGNNLVRGNNSYSISSSASGTLPPVALGRSKKLSETSNEGTSTIPSSIKAENLPNKDAAKVEMSLIHFKARNQNWVPGNQKIEHWLSQNFAELQGKRQISKEPDMEDLMGSKSTYNYLNDSASRDFQGGAYDPRMHLMNSSMMRLHENYSKRDRKLSVQHTTTTNNEQSIGINTYPYQSTMTQERSLFNQENQTPSFRYKTEDESMETSKF